MMDSIGNEYPLETDFCGTFRKYSYKVIHMYSWLNTTTSGYDKAIFLKNTHRGLS